MEELLKAQHFKFKRLFQKLNITEQHCCLHKEEEVTAVQTSSYEKMLLDAPHLQHCLSLQAQPLHLLHVQYPQVASL
jgi:hypothetical protein